MDKAGFMTMARAYTNGDAALMKLAGELAVSCEATTDRDRCEMGYKLAFCIRTEESKIKQELEKVQNSKN